MMDYHTCDGLKCNVRSKGRSWTAGNWLVYVAICAVGADTGFEPLSQRRATDRHDVAEDVRTVADLVAVDATVPGRGEQLVGAHLAQRASWSSGSCSARAEL